MKPLIATLICFCGIIGLFYLDREKKDRPSKALWLSAIYIWIVGSRSVSDWLGMAPGTGVDVQLEGSPLDAAVFAGLLAGAIGVLFRRKNKCRILLMANWPILLYFGYCLVSVFWSSHPDVAIKRWIKATGDLAMVLVIITDAHPVAALKRVISRVGFILLPLSLLFIKYYDKLGREYTPDGLSINTGVTTNKNVFGVVLLVVSLGAVWQIGELLRSKGGADRRRHLIAQSVLLLFGLVLLRMADSATSLACFVIGAGLLVAMNLRIFRSRPGRVQFLCLGIVTAAAFMFLFSVNHVATALGRNSNLSGRTDIWAALIPTVPNALVGAGFESYWISPSATELWNSLSRAGWWHPEILVTEAHNGYIEVFLNLGWIGIILIALLLATGFRRGISAFRVNPSIGSLMLPYVIVSAIYCVTEAGFRSLNPMWIFLLLSIEGSTAAMFGFFGERVKRRQGVQWRTSQEENQVLAAGSGR